VKALVIFWNPVEDHFGFHTGTLVYLPSKKYTNRYILSETSKLFDLFGWLAPMIVRAKILMQNTWKVNIDWD